jgi:manganese oxidase
MYVLWLAAQIAAASLPVAEPNDHTRPAGRLASGELTINLEAREGAWFPETRKGPGVRTNVFAEVGGRASVPGPMIRVKAGTRVRATVHNRLDKPLMMRGLHDHVDSRDSVDIAPGQNHTFDFVASAPGTFLYWGRTLGNRLMLGAGADGTLSGVLVVDPPGPRPVNERLLVLQLWTGSNLLTDTAGAPPRQLETMMVNGLSWPHSERLYYTVGDTVRWRVVNASVAPHPMHLHGFYFDVDARGTLVSDTTYDALSRRLAVTEFMAPGTTMRMTWVPTRAGNWLFHCHLIAHVDVNHLRLGQPHGSGGAHGASHAAGHTVNHAEEGMAGLVTGIHVKPRRGARAAAEPEARRKLRTFVNARPNVFGDRPGYAMILQQGPTEPARDSITIPGSALILRRGEPTEIVVHNRIPAPVTLHWHGIELESYYDGVGGWSGAGKRVAPAIAPGDSFVVRIIPDRAGTFIYHTHMEEGGQLSSGLYGALLVLPPNVEPDTATDRIFLLGDGGPQHGAPPVINGTPTSEPLDLRAGVTYRFRLINISPSNIKRIRLITAADSAVQTWRAFAKDGAELPAHQATVGPSSVLVGPGETYDFEVTSPAPADLVLEVRTAIRRVGPSITRVPVGFR